MPHDGENDGGKAGDVAPIREMADDQERLAMCYQRLDGANQGRSEDSVPVTLPRTRAISV